MKNLSLKINFLAFGIILFLGIFLPWHAFLITFISSFFGSTSDFLPKISFLIASWKEVLILFLGILFIGKWIYEKKFPIKKFFIFDKIFFGFLGLAIIFTIFSENIFQGILGFRLHFEFFILFYLLRGFIFTKNNLKNFLKIFLFSSFLALFFSFYNFSHSFNWIPNKISYQEKNFINLSDKEKLFIKKFYNEKGNKTFEKNTKELQNFFEHHKRINFRNENFLNQMLKFGYSKNLSSYNPNKPLPAFHFIEAKNSARFAGTFSGPNQMGFFLNILISLLLGLFLFSGKIKEKVFYIFLIFLSLIFLYFTFSRSSWIGIIFIFSIFFFLNLKKKWRLKVFLLGFILGILSIFFVQKVFPDFFNRVILREGSSSVHFEKSKKGFLQVLENPGGIGIGKAGPVSIRFSKWNEQNISENWFIQIAQEFGVFGFFIYFIFILYFLKFLFQNLKENLFLFSGFLGILGILSIGMFLHSFEDTASSLILFIILGLGFMKK